MKRFLATIPLLLLGLASCGAPSTPFSLLPDSSNEAPVSEEVSQSPSIPEKSSPAPAISSSEPPKTSSTQIEVSSEQPFESLSSEEAVPSEIVVSSEQPSISSEDPIVISEEPVQSSEPEVHLDPHEIYGGYYASLSTWDDGDDLKAKLHEIIHGGTYQPLTYAGSVTNWVSNSEADEYLYDHEFVISIIFSLQRKMEIHRAVIRTMALPILLRRALPIVAHPIRKMAIATTPSHSSQPITTKEGYHVQSSIWQPCIAKMNTTRKTTL